MNIGRTSEGMPYSRYIMSWINKAGYHSDHSEFVNWLKSEGLKENEIEDMRQMLSWGGKFEFEVRMAPFVERSNAWKKKTRGYKGP